MEEEGELFQNFLNVLFNLVRGEFVIGGGEDQVKRHTLFALTDGVGAVHVKQSNLGEIFAGGLNRLGDLCAGESFIGNQGKALKKVGIEARRTLEQFFGKRIFLETFVKVDKDWRNSDKELRSFGYNLE